MGALPLELLGPPSLHPTLQPTDAQAQTKREKISSAVTRLEGAPVEEPHSFSFSDLRAGELKDVADGLLEHHDDGHLDEEVGEAAARMALQREVKTAVTGRYR